jgi:hypothetical protein
MEATAQHTVVHQLHLLEIVGYTACWAVNHRRQDKQLLESQIPQMLVRRCYYISMRSPHGG